MPALAFAGSWQAAALLIVVERTGKALRGPARDVLLSEQTHKVGHGWGFGLHAAMDQTGAVLGPLLMVVTVARIHHFAPAFLRLAFPAALAFVAMVAARLVQPSDAKPPKSAVQQELPKVFWMYIAAAGLLDGYEATTHWSTCDDLAARHPGVRVLADRIHVQDRDRWTSAGVTAGIDLFLALVDADHGAELAHTVAAWLVVFARRPGGQSQFSAQLRAQAATTPTLAELQRWLPDHLDEPLGVEALAARVGMSPRTFARCFARETGTTPAAFVEELRVETARRLLESTDLTIGAIAARVGMNSPETLHRAFQRRAGTTPDRYRQHFSRRAS